MKKILLAFCILLSANFFGQIDKIAQYKIIKAKQDNEDVSAIFMKNDAHLVFYLKGNIGYFANVWKETKSMSIGRIESLVQIEKLRKLESGGTEDVFKFIWHYENSYDDVKGKALVIFRKVYKKNRPIYFLCDIYPETSETLELDGIMVDDDNE